MSDSVCEILQRILTYLGEREKPSADVVALGKQHARDVAAVLEAFERAEEAEVLGGALNDACELLCGALFYTSDTKTPEEWRQYLIDTAARRKERDSNARRRD